MSLTRAVAEAPWQAPMWGLPRLGMGLDAPSQKTREESLFSCLAAGQNGKLKPLDSSGSKGTGGKWLPRQMVLFNSCVRPPGALRAAGTITHILPFSLECLQSAGQVLKRTTISLKTIRTPSFISSALSSARALQHGDPQGAGDRGGRQAGRCEPQWPAELSPTVHRRLPPKAPVSLETRKELRFKIRLSPNASFFHLSSDI